MQLNVASLDDIRAGRVTDVYFERAIAVLENCGADRRVTMEVTCSSFPDGYDHAILAGLDEVAAVVEGLDAEIEALPEGTLFARGEPVMRLSGRYTHFGAMETAILGLLCQASGVATKAARCKHAAGERRVMSFGARRMHPAIAPMIERAAYLGGCDGVAVVQSAELLGIPPAGTMPHALIIIMGGLAPALAGFDRHVPPGVPRVALIDTFTDEKFGALEAAEALGRNLDSVRLDTPGSRRGNFAAILAEVRWELDLRGHQHVKLVVSGDIDEDVIPELNPLVSGYGIGTAISNARVINFALDIVEIEGKPITKRGKKSGAKEVWVCGGCGARRLSLRGRDPAPCGCGGAWEAQLRPFLWDGKVVAELPPPAAIRERVMGQVKAWQGRAEATGSGCGVI
jgi:nicotinate phosphoribosyltransferase